ncbi:sensor histidine kinase [Streptomyces sp. NPDC057963]|uniref:sensor histidine kinase n=1 Tax=Streptomyces sp. NPDC057963 TaxID=3346290 RepID=UPI0036E51FCB
MLTTVPRPMRMIRTRIARLPFRVRLATAFSGVFLLSGAALVTFVALLARSGIADRVRLVYISGTPQTPAAAPSPSPSVMGPSSMPPGGRATDHAAVAAEFVQDAVLHQLLLWSGVGLLIMAVISGFVGWWLAGRALKPVAAVTEAAHRIGDGDLHERLALVGPDDDLHRLADTFDSMLERLERSFDSQRRFVANASHELRTPLTVQRTLLEVGLADPIPPELAGVRDDLLESNRDAERLIEALLLLAGIDRGLAERHALDLRDPVRQAVAQLGPLAAAHDVTIRVETGPVEVTGDPVLLRHLVTNLVRNAIQYNHPGGHVQVTVGGSRLTVTNSGEHIAPDRMPALFEPFRRLGADRTSTSGHGLGLSIVRSIAQAQGANISAVPGPGGGLTITVEFAGVPGRSSVTDHASR